MEEAKRKIKNKNLIWVETSKREAERGWKRQKKKWGVRLDEVISHRMLRSERINLVS